MFSNELYNVSITFTDGEYKGQVSAHSINSAIALALTDARCASAHQPQYFGKVIAAHAELANAKEAV